MFLISALSCSCVYFQTLLGFYFGVLLNTPLFTFIYIVFVNFLTFSLKYFDYILVGRPKNQTGVRYTCNFTSYGVRKLL